MIDFVWEDVISTIQLYHYSMGELKSLVEYNDLYSDRTVF
jgi:hypothetical protein